MPILNRNFKFAINFVEQQDTCLLALMLFAYTYIIDISESYDRGRRKIYYMYHVIYVYKAYFMQNVWNLVPYVTRM